MGDCLSLSLLVLLFFRGGSKASVSLTGFTYWQRAGRPVCLADSGARVSLLLLVWFGFSFDRFSGTHGGSLLLRSYSR
jgi:hypothetical protein